MNRPVKPSVAAPLLVATLPEDAMFKVLGKRVQAVAIKRISDGAAKLRPCSVLLLMMFDGTVAVFDNTDEAIIATSGPREGGWDAALSYMQGSMRVVHQYQFDDAKPSKARGDSEERA